MPGGRPTAPRRNTARRPAGRERRSQLLDAAVELFCARGLAGVSLSEIAAAAGAHPSQVTYYFGSKEALFVEAACRDLLIAGSEVEAAGRRARSRAGYARALVDTATRSPALGSVIQAMALVVRPPAPAPPRGSSARSSACTRRAPAPCARTSPAAAGRT